MKGQKILLGSLVIVGFLIALVSFYEISIEETMLKLGLAKIEVSNMVDVNKLSRVKMENESDFECGMMVRTKETMRFLLNRDSLQPEIGRRLGERRIGCGLKMMKDNKFKLGTYEITKGLGYLKKAYEAYAIKPNIKSDKICDQRTMVHIDKVMKSLMRSTSGEVYQLLSHEWQEVIILRDKVIVRCLD